MSQISDWFLVDYRFVGVIVRRDSILAVKSKWYVSASDWNLLVLIIT